jgi:hypothetical protein
MIGAPLVEISAARLLDAGVPAVVLAPGMPPPDLGGLPVLAWDGARLAPPGVAGGAVRPLPADARLLAILAPDAATATGLAQRLPAGVPVLAGPDALPRLLALLGEALRGESVRRDVAEGERDAARRALGGRPLPVPQLILDTPPVAAAPPRLTQPLGRPAQGLCRAEIHLAEAGAGPASSLQVRLVAGQRIRAAWAVPGPELLPGWLALDLPEPAQLGAAEAVLEVALHLAQGDAAALSAGVGEAAPLALRLWTSEPGRHVMPRHFDWAALDAPMPRGLELNLDSAALAVTGTTDAAAELLALGSGAERLVLRLDAGAMADVTLAPLPASPADLLRLTLACRAGEAERIGAALRLDHTAGAAETEWRDFDAEGVLRLALPLPGSGARPCLRLRNGGGPAVVEVARLVLLRGAAGECRRPPEPDPPRMPLLRASSGAGVVLPGGLRMVQRPAAVAHPPAERLAGGITWQEVKTQQHMVSPDGAYCHLDIVITGLVTPAGLWRQARAKLFERRGTPGLEFREAPGWPQMFDRWPAGDSDAFGPFWRLEGSTAGQARSALATLRDRTFVASLIEVLPSLAAQAAAEAGLGGAEAAAWTERAQRLGAALAEGRPQG